MAERRVAKMSLDRAVNDDNFEFVTPTVVRFNDGTEFNCLRSTHILAEVIAIPEFAPILSEMLGAEVKVVSKPVAEYAMEVMPGLQSHGVRFDVFVETTGGFATVELQTAQEDNIAKRIRYYQSALTMSHALKSGEKYDKLRNTFVVFLCDKDPFRQGGIFKYEIKTDALGVFGYDDGAKSFVYVCSVPTPDNSVFSEFLNLYNGYRPLSSSVSFDELLHRVEEMFSMTNGREMIKYASRAEARAAGIAQGIAQGIEQGIAQGIEQGIAQGIEQGLAQGIAQGVTQGKVAANANTILRFMVKKNVGFMEAIDELCFDEQEASEVLRYLKEKRPELFTASDH